MLLVKDHQESIVAELSNREQRFVALQQEDMGLVYGE